MSAPSRLLRAAALALLLAGCRTAAPAPSPVPPPPAPDPVEELLPAAPAPVREFRGAWISPLWGGEWPRPGLTADEQRARLIEVLERARASGLNAIVLHVRPAADALYPTARAPWSGYLTGTLGRAPQPAWDPLAFAIDEAHRRGLELHAWFNPFRAAPPDRRTTPVAGHVAFDHPERVLRYGDQQWVDPGIPAARRAVLDDILEVVERYDIDGVHLDDYFYPYVQQRTVRRGGRSRTENIPFPDSASWRRYGEAAGFDSRAEWRRSNIDGFVATLYREVKARRPEVLVGISPFGIWRPGSPPGITGLDAYAEIYADARRWLREGWVDYLAPQLYWPIDGAQHRFTRLDAWWRSENVHGRHLWPGLYTERETAAKNAWAAGEIARQIDTLRAVRAAGTESLGHIHFRMQALRSGPDGLGTALRARSYREPALTPASPWLDRRAPAAPRLTVVAMEDPARAALLHVAPGDSMPVRWWLLHLLGDDGEWRLERHDGRARALALPAPVTARAAMVRGISRTGIEGPPTTLRLR